MSQSVSQNPEAAVSEELELAEEAEIEAVVDAEVAEIEADDAASDEAPEVVPAVVVPIVMERPIQTVGRRKEAVVRIRLMPGNGTFTLNGRTMDNYFPNKVHQQLINEPFVILGLEGQWDVIARIHGGGITGQAGALRMGISRALQISDPDSRPALKKAGLKKARKAPQYSKR